MKKQRLRELTLSEVNNVLTAENQMLREMDHSLRTTARGLKSTVEDLTKRLERAELDLKIEKEASTNAYKKLAAVCETCKRKKADAYECWGCRYDELLGYTVRLRGGLVTIHDVPASAQPIAKALLDVQPPEIRLATLPSDIMRWAVVGAGLAVAAWALIGGKPK